MLRKIKKSVKKLTETELKVREATSNDPNPSNPLLLAEIAELSHDPLLNSQIMPIILRRLNDEGKNWRHVYKSLVLLGILVKTGCEKILQQCNENIPLINKLKFFRYEDGNKFDHGSYVRDQAKSLVEILENTVQLRKDRDQAEFARTQPNGIYDYVASTLASQAFSRSNKECKTTIGFQSELSYKRDMEGEGASAAATSIQFTKKTTFIKMPSQEDKRKKSEPRKQSSFATSVENDLQPGIFLSDLKTDKWTDEKAGVAYTRHNLAPDDAEFKTVVNNIKSKGSSTWINRIKQISRIENYKLFNVYMSCKRQMERTNGSYFENERILWHGTSCGALTDIYRDGFNRSYAGKNGTMYGEGVYFADDIETSVQPKYSPVDSNGVKYIFQCRVLTGKFTLGSQGLKEPPMRTRDFLYDSVVDKMPSPAIFVIFKDHQVYPEYIISLNS